MPDPFFLILGLIAIACVVLFPIRLWRRKHHRYGPDDDEASRGAPLSPPKRRDSD